MSVTNAVGRVRRVAVRDRVVIIMEMDKVLFHTLDAAHVHSDRRLF